LASKEWVKNIQTAGYNGARTVYRIWTYIPIGIVGHFWTIQSILCMSKKFTNSINQKSNTKKQSTINIESCTENEYVNGIQKVPQQNFGAY
jgi:hypothetical protein